MRHDLQPFRPRNRGPDLACLADSGLKHGRGKLSVRCCSPGSVVGRPAANDDCDLVARRDGDLQPLQLELLLQV